MDKLEQSFNSTVNSYLGFLDNEYISSALHIVLIVYASMVAPSLPESVASYFDNNFVKLAFFFMIAYTGRKDPSVAAIAAIGLMVTLQTINRYHTNHMLQSNVEETTKIVEQAAVQPVVSESSIDSKPASLEAFSPSNTDNQESHPANVDNNSSDSGIDGPSDDGSQEVAVEDGSQDEKSPAHVQYKRSDMSIYAAKNGNNVGQWNSQWDNEAQLGDSEPAPRKSKAPSEELNYAQTKPGSLDRYNERRESGNVGSWNGQWDAPSDFE